MVINAFFLLLPYVLMLLTVGLTQATNGTGLSLPSSLPLPAYRFLHTEALLPALHDAVTSRDTNSGRAVSNAYYDFLINEGSYKFWAVFQLATVAILLYSVFAAIYYAKFQYLTDPPTSDIDDLFRANGGLGTLDKNTILIILEALDAFPSHPRKR